MYDRWTGNDDLAQRATTLATQNPTALVTQNRFEPFVWVTAADNHQPHRAYIRGPAAVAPRRATATMVMTLEKRELPQKNFTHHAMFAIDDGEQLRLWTIHDTYERDRTVYVVLRPFTVANTHMTLYGPGTLWHVKLYPVN